MRRFLIVAAAVWFALWSGDVVEAACNPGRPNFDFQSQAGASDTGTGELAIIEGSLTSYNPYVQPNNGGSINASTLWIMMRSNDGNSYIQVGFRKNQGNANSSPWIQWNNDSDPSTGFDFYFPEYYTQGTQLLFQIRHAIGGTRYDVYWGNPNNGTFYWKYGVDLNFLPTAMDVATEKLNYNDQQFGALFAPAYASGLRYLPRTPGAWQGFQYDYYVNDGGGMNALFWGEPSPYGSDAGFFDSGCGY